MHVIYLGAKMSIYPMQKVEITLLLVKKVSIYKKYTHFSDVFSKKFAAVLPKRSDINEHVIDLKPSEQLPYKPIYSLGLIELKTFKTCIKTNLANGFIRSSKFLAGAPILFV